MGKLIDLNKYIKKNQKEQTDGFVDFVKYMQDRAKGKNEALDDMLKRAHAFAKEQEKKKQERTKHNKSVLRSYRIRRKSDVDK